jgi:uncharacterized protein
MIGLLVQLAISWLIIWLFERKNLSVLGLRPTQKRITDFVIFFLLLSACCASGYLFRMYLGEKWEVNPAFNATLLFEGLWWNIKSVLFEELMFRGVILYILIKRTGAVPAIIISAIAFGIYHWFSFGIFGDVKQMIITFFITGTMGLVLAYGYQKSGSLYIPIAIHLGWNFTNIFIFSNGPIGKGLLYQPQLVQIQVSIFTYIMAVWMPLLLALSCGFLLVRKRNKII